MNEDELETQAQLWHARTPLPPEKTETLRKALADATPQARRRHHWRIGGLAALALASVPLGGALVVSLGTDPRLAQTRIEALTFPEGKLPVDGLALAADGTVAGECARTRGDDGIGAPRPEPEFRVWPPHSSAPKTLRPPVGTVSHLYYFLPTGELAVTVTYPDKTYRFALWNAGAWRFLRPLPGYDSSVPPPHLVTTSQGIVGHSLKFPTKQGTARPSQWTLWRGETPEPLPEGLLAAPSDLFASSKTGDRVLTSSGELYSNGERTRVPCEGRDGRGALLWKATPRGIGGKQIIVGELVREGEEDTIALWTSPAAPPRPLWEKSSPLSPLPLRYGDIDTEGEVVGELKDPLTGAITPFIWKDGRYRDLQTLLPRSSGWKLQTATRVAGRTVLGMGQYRGQPATYRLTLPPNFP